MKRLSVRCCAQIQTPKTASEYHCCACSLVREFNIYCEWTDAPPPYSRLARGVQPLLQTGCYLCVVTTASSCLCASTLRTPMVGSPQLRAMDQTSPSMWVHQSRVMVQRKKAYDYLTNSPTNRPLTEHPSVPIDVMRAAHCCLWMPCSNSMLALTGGQCKHTSSVRRYPVLGVMYADPKSKNCE